MTQQPIGRGPLPAKDVVNLGDPLPTEQCVTTLKPLAADQENPPALAQSAPKSAPNRTARLAIDKAQVYLHLQLLGRDERDTNIRGIFHKGKKGPAINGNLARDIDRAQEWQANGMGLYLQPNPGGTKVAEVDECIALWYEHDDIPRYLQDEIYKDHGLPMPSFMVDTGGKSIHQYYVLEEPLAVEPWNELMDRLQLAAKGCDRSCKGANRLMRLAGSWYIDRNGNATERAEIMWPRTKRFTFEELDAVLPQLPKRTTPGPRPSSSTLMKKRPSSRCDLSVRQIATALDHIPRRVGGTGTYAMYRDVLWGLKAAIADAGADEALAIQLMEAHSPSTQCDWDVEQVARSGGEHIGPGTLFHHAKQYGWSRHAR